MSEEGAEMTLSPAAPASLPDDDDLLREILLRLPPLPSSLPRASSVCKRWRRLATDPQFLRRFRAHHRKPPLLGVFDQPEQIVFKSILDSPDRIPSGRFSNDGIHGGQLQGCRHGRVIARAQHGEFIVFDPITRERWRVDVPPEFKRFYVSGTVLCAAGDRGHVHGTCHSSPFKVVLVSMYRDYHEPLACVYSSDTGVWGNLISMADPRVVCPTANPSILAGNALYWLLASDGILEFDLDKQSLTVIKGPPLPPVIDSPHQCIIQAEDGGIGLAMLSYPSFQMWQRKFNSHGVATWVLGKSVDMHSILSLPIERVIATIVGYAEDAHVIFLFVGTSFYMVQLESMLARRLDQLYHISIYHPFTSFYTPGTSVSG